MRRPGIKGLPCCPQSHAASTHNFFIVFCLILLFVDEVVSEVEVVSVNTISFQVVREWNPF
jgi:hypothetical protein